MTLRETDIELPATTHTPEPIRLSSQGGASEAVHHAIDTHETHDRFADPLIYAIRETWRKRQDFVRAQSRLILQAKAICRRFCAGDKTEADRLYAAIVKGGEHELVGEAALHIQCFLVAMEPLVERRNDLEKELARLGGQLPIAHMADRIKGINCKTLAVIAAECGDLSAYEKGIAGIWKRAGLAVVDGERQRKMPGEAALEHGYSPERRAVFWTIGDALLKAQGKDETAGPYRRLYDERKAYEFARLQHKGHAHNRALRYMTKRLLRELWREWKKVSHGRIDEGHPADAEATT